MYNNHFKGQATASGAMSKRSGEDLVIPQKSLTIKMLEDANVGTDEIGDLVELNTHRERFSLW